MEGFDIGSYQNLGSKSDGFGRWMKEVACSLCTIHRQNLRDFVRKAFAIRRQKMIRFQDDKGRTFDCNVSKGRNISEVNIGGEWKKLCTANGLKNQSLTELAIDPRNPKEGYIYIYNP